MRLTALEGRIAGVFTMNIAIREYNNDILFLHLSLFPALRIAATAWRWPALRVCPAPWCSGPEPSCRG